MRNPSVRPSVDTAHVHMSAKQVDSLRRLTHKYRDIMERPEHSLADTGTLHATSLSAMRILDRIFPVKPEDEFILNFRKHAIARGSAKKCANIDACHNIRITLSQARIIAFIYDNPGVSPTNAHMFARGHGDRLSRMYKRDLLRFVKGDNRFVRLYVTIKGRAALQSTGYLSK